MSLEVALALIGIVLTLVGFGTALYQIRIANGQIRRAVTAAKAAERAVSQTERLRAVIDLSRTAPELQRIERNLAIAVRDGQRESAENQLQDWRAAAADMRGLLQGHDFGSGGLQNRLHEASMSAMQTVSLLDNTDLTSATKTVVTLIATATDEAATLVGRLRSTPISEGVDQHE